jgi:hypothetical protein
LVGIGLVGPRRVRPVSGVWASVSSRPVPPRITTFLAAGALVAAARFTPGRRLAGELFRLAALTFRAGAAFAFAVRFSLRAVGRFAGLLRFALPFGVLAPAVFRLAATARFPALGRLVEDVRLCPFVLPLFLAIAVSLLRCNRRRFG